MLLRLAAISAFVVVQVSAQAPPTNPPDLVLYNGTIITVDSRFSMARAVAITGNRISAVGDDAAVQKLARSTTRVIDLAGRTVVPGLMDNHLHSAGGGPGIDLSRARSIDDVLRAVAERVRTLPPGGIVVSNSDWHEAQLKEQRLPLRDDLDRVAPSHPVVLVRGGHEFIVNSPALSQWKIDEHTREPEGGRISRYSDGRLNGELVDTAKSLVALPRARPLSVDERIDERMAEYRKLHAAGLTTVRHPGIPVEHYRLLQEMKRRGVLTMRVHALLRPFDAVAREKAAEAASGVTRALDEAGVTPDEGDDWLTLSGVKLAVDGGFEGGLLRDPYEEPYGEHGSFRGLQTVDSSAYVEVVRALNKRGWRVATHAVGDAAIDLVLKAYEVANSERTIVGRRWTIEHAFIGRPDHLPKMKALGVAISAQNHLYLAGPVLVKYWGAERAGLTTPVRRYLDAGLLVSSGTDAAVVPYPPLWTIYHFVTRDTMSGGVLGPAQRITRQEAIKMATINNARLMFDERNKGSIELGKLADLVVLSDNILTCPEPRIRDAEVLMTIVGGRIVFERDARSSAGQAGRVS